MSHVNLIKLSVGSKSVETLEDWQATRKSMHADGRPRHITRMWPKKADEVLAGGSIYWVIQGLVQCRQKLLGFEEVIGADGIRRCAFVLDAEIVRTCHTQRRPFQGWRYLAASDAPADLPSTRQNEDALPADLSAALADIGVI